MNKKGTTITSTLAPGGKFTNYIHDKDYAANKDPYNSDPKFKPVMLTVPKATSLSIVYDIQNYFPYVPGLSESIHANDGGGDPFPATKFAKITAGTDCSNFVQRAYCWTGSKYKAVNTISQVGSSEQFRRQPPYWTTDDDKLPYAAMNYMVDNNYAIKITQYGKETIIGKKNTYPQFSLLVPGDIVYYPGHIMMIRAIKKPSGPENSYIPGDIDIIESVWSNVDPQGFGTINIRSINDLNLPAIQRQWSVWRENE